MLIFGVLRHLLHWCIRVIPLAVLVGSAVALFLYLLDAVTLFRFVHPWLLDLLPVGGLATHFIYRWLGKSSEGGNNLVLEEIHEYSAGVPRAMAPLVFISTLITHLFGGSAGREGTAVQMGAGMASLFSSRLKTGTVDGSLMLVAGVAAGFGAVFGTPVTGAIFALEVLAIGRIRYDALFPAFVASIVANFTVHAWQVKHAAYHIADLSLPVDPFSRALGFDILLLGKVIFAAICFGLAARLFAYSAHGLKTFFGRHIRQTWLIPVAGGIILIILTSVLATPDYLGLGTLAAHPGAVTLSSSFTAGGAGPLSWFGKGLYTVVTLGTGFKGGEVTPLFYIGASLGNVLAMISQAPVSLFAALGFIAVFAGASNTPLACTIMGVELFGGEYLLYYAVACFTAYYFSGHSGIYSAQKTSVAKLGQS